MISKATRREISYWHNGDDGDDGDVMLPYAAAHWSIYLGPPFHTPLIIALYHVLQDIYVHDIPYWEERCIIHLMYISNDHLRILRVPICLFRVAWSTTNSVLLFVTILQLTNAWPKHLIYMPCWSFLILLIKFIYNFFGCFNTVSLSYSRSYITFPLLQCCVKKKKGPLNKTYIHWNEHLRSTL